MGYDMSAVGEATEAEQVLHEQASEAFRLAQDALKEAGEQPPWGDEASTPLQRAWEQAWDRKAATDVTYFRLNVWGMGIARDLMDRMGMITWVDERGPDSPLPPWPTDAEVKAERERLGRTEEEDDWAERGEGTWHLLAQPRLSWTMTDSPTLLGHKLCSNDPWVITSGECKAVTMRWAQLEGTPELAEILAGGTGDDGTEPGRRASLTELPRWWDRWMAWHERCAQRGGYIQG